METVRVLGPDEACEYVLLALELDENRCTVKEFIDKYDMLVIQSFDGYDYYYFHSKKLDWTRENYVYTIIYNQTENHLEREHDVRETVTTFLANTLPEALLWGVKEEDGKYVRAQPKADYPVIEGTIEYPSYPESTVGKTDSLGRTLFLRAIKYDSPEEVELLAKEGIDVKDVDNGGNNALWYAYEPDPRENGKIKDFVWLLLSLGVDRHRENDHGISPWLFAITLQDKTYQRAFEEWDEKACLRIIPCTT